MIRYLAALSAGLTALNGFLLALPGDAVSQSLLLLVGGASAASAAMVAVLAKPIQG